MFILCQNKTLWGPLKLIACLKNWDLGMRLKTGNLKNVAQSLRRSTTATSQLTRPRWEHGVQLKIFKAVQPFCYSIQEEVAGGGAALKAAGGGRRTETAAAKARIQKTYYY